MEFSMQQLQRIDYVYGCVERLMNQMTNDDVIRQNDVYALADVVAEFMTGRNYPVYFPVHIEDENGERIVDIFE